jgi:hypothetical protein
MSSFTIQLPSQEKSLKTTLELLDKFIVDIILYLVYGTAILSGLKFIIHILNGFASKSYMGASTLDNPSFGNRKDW